MCLKSVCSYTSKNLSKTSLVGSFLESWRFAGNLKRLCHWSFSCIFSKILRIVTPYNNRGFKVPKVRLKQEKMKHIRKTVDPSWLLKNCFTEAFQISDVNPFRPDPGRRDKINFNFYFHTSMKWLIKAFIKPSEAPQRSVKIKLWVNFDFNITFWNVRDGKG